MRFRSVPQEVEAVQWIGTNLPAVTAFASSVTRYTTAQGLQLRAGKNGAQGWVPVPVGHWIVRVADDMSDHWPVESQYFWRKYELAEEVQP